jgi:hypothetical protein
MLRIALWADQNIVNNRNVKDPMSGTSFNAEEEQNLILWSIYAY